MFGVCCWGFWNVKLFKVGVVWFVMKKKWMIILGIAAILFIFLGPRGNVGTVIRWILLILGGLILFIWVPYSAYKKFKVRPVFSCFLFGLIISSILSFIIILISGSGHWHMRSLSIFLGVVLSFFVFVVIGVLSVIIGWVIGKRRAKKSKLL